MTSITYLKGDATDPSIQGHKIIIHCCNNCSPGAWGKGFVLALSRRWKEPESEYKKWSRGLITYKPYELGQVQYVKVEKDLVVANMLGQEGLRTKNGKPPIRYDAINKCLKDVAKIALKYKASVHSPRFGAGLAGGEWSKIEELIVENLCKKDIEVYVYDLE